MNTPVKKLNEFGVRNLRPVLLAQRLLLGGTRQSPIYTLVPKPLAG